MIVVDSSAALAALLGRDAARTALTDRRLIAPHVIDAEVAHALRGLVLGGKLPEPEASRILGVWRELAVDRLPMRGLLPRVWELRDNLSAHDALFVAAAEVHEVPLVTADRRLASAPGTRCTIELIAGASGPV